MSNLYRLYLIVIFLLLNACAGGPQQQGSSTDEAAVQQKKQLPQEVLIPLPPESIVPDINAEGKRGDFARAILARSSARFLNADTDRNYLISIEEAEIHFPHVSREFLRYDKNGDGGVSWQEYLGHDEWPAPVHGE